MRDGRSGFQFPRPDAVVERDARFSETAYLQNDLGNPGFASGVNSSTRIDRWHGSRRNESAQVHMIEMITLFWLFFMAATFVIQLQVPDPTSAASDAALQLAAEDAWVRAVATEADGSDDSRLHELLAAGNRMAACEMLLGGLSSTVDGNCWLAVDAAPIQRHGDGSSPQGRSTTVHHMLHVDGEAWTVALQVWHVGGGAG